MTEERRHLTTRQGHPVHDNQNERTVGPRGPATLENYQFLERISHFDRERIPERVVHARGFTAYGTFTATGRWGDEPIERFTRAKLFAAEGKQTEVALRFSTVIGGRDSSEAARDPRGFAVRFYTEDGTCWSTCSAHAASRPTTATSRASASTPTSGSTRMGRPGW
ncbi:catalase [Pseudonocardia sp. ICBG1034]|uniref:catalase n=1 Tax=Pseudonocardia sp. ICBG1034 TaxID=2844381 RepID=UPI00272EE4D1|nr:catalase [Pseudonocardia sp. ICBG1034]